MLDVKSNKMSERFIVHFHLTNKNNRYVFGCPVLQNEDLVIAMGGFIQVSRTHLFRLVGLGPLTFRMAFC